MFEVLWLILVQEWRYAKAYADAKREIWLHEQSRSMYTHDVQTAYAICAHWHHFSPAYSWRAYVMRWLLLANQRYNPYVWWRWQQALKVRREEVEQERRVRQLVAR